MDACDRLKNWEDLDVTREEIEDLTKCLKQDDFRKLLIEYAEEVTNPENRKIYEKEIGELEKERGIDVKFINPEPGYVIKTSVNGDKKCFINISKSDIVGKPTSQPSCEDGNRGLQWSIPFTLAPPRDDVDKKKNYCTVFDVVFHPDTLYLASKNSRFRNIVNDTAIDGVEKNFKVKLDRKNLKYPKMDFKGITQSTVIRKKLDIGPSNDPPSTSLDIEPEIYQKLMSSYDESREKYAKKFDEKPSRPPPPTTYLSQSQCSPKDIPTPFTTPKFLIKHQTDVDIQDFQISKNSKLKSTIPKKLVIIIDLPLLRSSTDATLDVQERLLTVTSEKPAKYRLELPLSYRVDPDNGNAKFDPKKRKLTVTLPVIRELKINEPIDDSGVDSDHGTPPLKTNIDKAESFDEMRENSTELIAEIKEINDDCGINGDIDSIITDDTFLSSIIKYSLPQFTCNIYDNTLAITVHVKNVDANSIKHKFLKNQSGIHLVFSSIGAGFFPMYYALCLKIQDNVFEDETVGIEPWDNNVVFTIGLKDINHLESYYVGVDEEFMEKKDLPHSICLDKKFESLECDNMGINGHRKIEVIPERDEIMVNIKANHDDSDDEDEENFGGEGEKLSLKKCRSVSESSGDELPGSHANRCRGILKYSRSNFSRSVSESSIDDTNGLASSIDFNYDSVQEINSESDCCSLKKTVRFNDVVSRQLYRSNSSILGRRKKNQRKLRKKKQAFERRMSESENSETEERDKYKIETKEESDNNTENVKPILNRDKSSVPLITNNEDEKSKDNDNASPRAEFKNDLIFDIDM